VKISFFFGNCSARKYWAPHTPIRGSRVVTFFKRLVLDNTGCSKSLRWYDPIVQTESGEILENVFRWCEYACLWSEALHKHA
jgi:hypothetical protein